ncbi:hypothetical protein DWU95_07780 [Burkholderia contaminans]|nr:hypothetical protein DWU95_07780 [Burkholderia contaminans]
MGGGGGAQERHGAEGPADGRGSCRASPTVGGGMTCVMHAIVVGGGGTWLEVGQWLEAEIGFGD